MSPTCALLEPFLTPLRTRFDAVALFLDEEFGMESV